MTGFGVRRSFAVLAAPALALTLSVVPPAVSTAAAATTKVVIVVGPVGDPLTSQYITSANTAAATFRKYTSNVITVYSPHATWSAVKSALQGANVVLYLGHGNGFPSPYSSTLNPAGMDGFGLNATDNAGNYNWKYYGESYISANIRFAPNAVVLFNRLCYASGNNEWGAGIPTLSVAKQRVDNYAAGFIAAGAKAVIADGIGDITWYIDALFTRHSTIDSLFRAAPDRHNNYVVWASSRSSGFTSIEDVGTYSWDPDGDKYYRSMVSIPSLSTDSAVGAGGASAPVPLTAKTLADDLNIRSGPSTGYGIVGSIASTGTTVTVTGAIVADSSGRTWAPISTSSGSRGYIVTQYARFGGSAKTTATVNVRSYPSTGSTVLTTLAAGARFSVVYSTTDSLHRTWLVTYVSGKAGYVAAWYTAP